MSVRARTSVVLLLLAVAVTALARKEETVDELKARVDAARPEEQSELCLEIAQRQLAAADDLYTEGKSEAAHAAIDDVVKYTEKARDISVKSGKDLKRTEISVRKMAAKLRDIKRSVSFEDQGPVDTAAQKLEDVRTDLLVRMFGKGKK